MAGFEVARNGRFWVATEGGYEAISVYAIAEAIVANHILSLQVDEKTFREVEEACRFLEVKSRNQFLKAQAYVAS